MAVGRATCRERVNRFTPKNGHGPRFLSRQCGKIEGISTQHSPSNVRELEKSESGTREFKAIMKYELAVTWQVTSTRPKEEF